MAKEMIDFVIIWVDGNDVNWQKEKKKFSHSDDSDSRDIRFRDWDNLKYWFRGVEKFAPWVHKIYFVTWGHLPEWLDITNEKLVVVNHKDYIPKDYLPTFNSHTIELNLHRINDLSEHFVYFNDDMFIIDKVCPDDFFKKGLPVDVAIESGIATSDPKMLSIYYNHLAIINKKFNKKVVIKNNLKNWFNYRYGIQLLRGVLAYPWRNFIGFYNLHAPQSFLKSTFNNVWKENELILDNTCKHKFRSELDVSQYLIRQWQLCSNTFEPKRFKMSKGYTITNSADDVCNHIRRQKSKLLCINDSDKISNEDFELFKKEVVASFEKILPEKSSFEK